MFEAFTVALADERGTWRSQSTPVRTQPQVFVNKQPNDIDHTCRILQRKLFVSEPDNTRSSLPNCTLNTTRKFRTRHGKQQIE